ncbi:hypothetical protein V501_05386 [Pseudogymnoascus sp. VKM F-4519 (FW-2642)]|nr:hypothetical protein V501_05386 [Pseudogymnoascus sp. VKM F-4519 (FW-2642)]
MAAGYFPTKGQSPVDSRVASPALSSTGQAPIRSNALSSKVNSVLSASYADLEIRDALQLLDERGVENTVETRRQLRLDIQKDVIDSNGLVIKEFGHVAEQLRRIGQSIANLNQGCEEMRRHITAAHQETAPVLDEASDLMARKKDVEMKQKLLQAFSAHFVMSDDDIATLTSTAEPVNDEFFIVLNRAKQIQVDCEILLSSENQRLGLEIMEQITTNLNGAFQKLYRWIQREFKSLNLENPQINASIRRALRVLAERPTLFQNCLDFFAEAREHILSDSFYTALTGLSVTGDEDKTVKPLELVAHDPLRYVGDMLAWTHSATVSEREALEVLFISDGNEIAKGIQAGRDSEPWNKYTRDEEADTVFDGHKALNDLVDRDVAGVARVLKQRIEQVIQSHDETILVYKISNLVNFYRVMFTKILGEDSALLSTLQGLEDFGLRQFRVLMRDHIASLQTETQQAPADLGLPIFLQEGLKQLTEIMKTYDTSFTSAKSREENFKTVLEDAFEPYIRGIETMAKDMEMPSNSIFIINCLLSCKTALESYQFTADRAEELGKTVEQHSIDLIEYQYAFFLQSSGLQRLVDTLQSMGNEPDLKKLVSTEAFQPQALKDASQILDDFLPSGLMDALDNLRQLQSSRLAREITEEAADRFCEDFEVVEERITQADGVAERSEDEEEEGEEILGLRALFPRTSGEIRVLLT